MHHRLLRPLFLVWALLALALPARADPPHWPFDTRVIMSGHSLTDPIEPVLRAMVQAMGGRGGVIHLSTIPGSPMDWRWSNPGNPVDARTEIGAYDLLVMTERVPLLDTMKWHNSPDEALRWARHAWDHGAAMVLYASWINLDTGPGLDDGTAETHLPFRARLEVENARWREIAAHANAGRAPDMPEIAMIPGPEIWMAVHDEITQGRAPLQDIADLFSDNIHVNGSGAYLIALAHLAVIYGADPRDVPRGLGRVHVPEPEIASWMQDLVWRVVSGSD